MGQLIIKLRDLGKPSIWAVAYGTMSRTQRCPYATAQILGFPKSLNFMIK